MGKSDYPTIEELQAAEESDELETEHNEQMELFAHFDLSKPKQKDYSNTVDIYDALPKYVWSSREQHDLKSASRTRECIIKGAKFTVKVKPALIERNNDDSVLIYPGQREELVEDALRKLAVSGQGVYVNGKAGVSFSLYELRTELEQMGHTYSFQELREALFICRGAVLECYSGDNRSVITSNFFGLLALTTQKDLEERGRDARCYVQFNPLVNESIMNLTFRQYNYKLGMELRSPLARYIYKRMAQYWTQASAENPYTPKLVSFLEQSPRGLTKRMSENLRAMRNALDILEKHEVIARYDEVKEMKGKQKVIDATYWIYPHPKFIKDVISANQRNKALRMKKTKQMLDAPSDGEG